MVVQLHQDDEIPWSLRRLLISTTAIPAAALALMISFPHDVCAAEISYSFTSDASLTFSNVHTEAVSGGFLFNTTSLAVSSLQITLTGPAPQAGVFDDFPDYVHVGATYALIGRTPSHTDGVVLKFADPLGGAADSFANTSSEFPGFGGSSPYFVTSFVGGVTTASAVPEPTTLSLLGAALGWFGLRRRRKRPPTGAPYKVRAASPARAEHRSGQRCPRPPQRS
jgi:hypothetical protein